VSRLRIIGMMRMKVKQPSITWKGCEYSKLDFFLLSSCFLLLLSLYPPLSSVSSPCSPISLVRYPADTLRFYLCSEAPYGSDVKFSEECLVNK
jgi:valyl-tRNA synthetase